MEVLLSTWNGERWLRPQLDSVLAQSHRDLVLTVRDDGSTDGTVQILAEYAALDPRVRWSRGSNLGAARSFLSLLQAADPECSAVAFCDQDDVWDSDHLARALLALAAVEGPSPRLWCSDVQVCDEHLVPLRRHGVVRRGPSFGNALVENVATGCTIVLDRTAVELLAGLSPRSVVMHDAWCYLVVAALGTVLYDPRPSVRYRLHGTNTMGLARGQLATLLARLQRAARGEHVGAWSRQAEELRRLLGHRLAPGRRRELDAFLAGRRPLLPRLAYCLRGQAHRQRLSGTVGARLLHLLGRL